MGLLFRFKCFKMNDLLEQLYDSHITLDSSDVNLKHPRYNELFKNKPNICDQEKRRKEWLDNRKKKREDTLNSSRGIPLASYEQSMDVGNPEQVCGSQEYRGYLMLSEWLIDVPVDLEEKWLCGICPEGTRALVVAEGGRTVAYRRNGKPIFQAFQSLLPGGSKRERRGKTKLDAVFNWSTKTFYILDVIFWGITTEDWDAEMRFYWLKNKLEEGSAEKNTKHMKYSFIPLEYFRYPELQKRMMVHPAYRDNNPKVDGIIFFHQESPYVHGRSPIVTWLKPFMLPDILKISIAPQYFDEKPMEYQQKMEIQ